MSGELTSGMRPLQEGPAIAELRLRIITLAPGQSEVSVQVSPNGPLADANGDGPSREIAYRALLEAAHRELTRALTRLGTM
jgi:hypothetical protein